jgi:hypothetical protein
MMMMMMMRMRRRVRIDILKLDLFFCSIHPSLEMNQSLQTKGTCYQGKWRTGHSAKEACLVVSVWQRIWRDVDVVFQSIDLKFNLEVRVILQIH